MVKSFQDIRIELSSRNIKNIYFFSACPKILFDELIYTLKSHLGKNVKLLYISQKTPIFSEFFNYDFFSGRKILIIDWDLYSPSKQQIKEIISLISKYSEKSKEQKSGNFLLARSYKKQLDKDVYKHTKDYGIIYWISWKMQDILSVVKSKFPDVKFLDDTDRAISDMVEKNFDDITGAVKKAVLYAYPRRYISAKDINSVIDPYDFTGYSKEELLKITFGELKNPSFLCDEERSQQLVPKLIQFLFSIIKIKAESKNIGFIDRFRISQELRIRNVDDKILNMLKSVDETSLSKNLLNLEYKSRIGIFKNSFYVYNFIKNVSRSNSENQ